MKVLLRLAAVKGIGWYVGLVGAALSLSFTFLIYPAIGESQHAVLDPDLHGPLGFGLWKYHTFSYYPSTEPASARGPLYPLFIAAMLAVSGGWFPYSVQLAQCLLFGLMCVLVFWTARTLWSPPLAVLAAALCALNPFLIWYTSRIWVEPLMMVLFTALIAGIVLIKQRPSAANAALVGLIVGLSVMTKSIYTPFLLLTPLLLVLPFGRRLPSGLAALVFITGVLVITPWSLRNARVTGIFAPEVGNTGFTLHQGNDFVEDFSKAPFSVSALYPLSLARMRAEDMRDEDEIFKPGMNETQRRNALDASRRHIAVQKLIDEPGFFVKKILYGLLLFWTFGDSLGKSVLIALLQLPLVALFCTYLVLRRRELTQGAVGICASLVVLFYFAHLPTIALARYSAVLVPAMLIVAVGIFQIREIDHAER
jgi:4-amino-4-deoxy-L-arabinose transferase-like glycosyltransferase